MLTQVLSAAVYIRGFVKNRIEKRRFFTQNNVKTVRFYHQTAFYSCGLGGARVDTVNCETTAIPR